MESENNIGRHNEEVYDKQVKQSDYEYDFRYDRMDENNTRSRAVLVEEIKLIRKSKKKF